MSGIAMGENYSHLTLEERCRLRGLMEMGLGVSEIARRLGRHRGTLYREIGRYVGGWKSHRGIRRFSAPEMQMAEFIR
jgi:IS30 family transposase